MAPMSNKSISAKQKRLAATLYLAILTFAILFWFISSKENAKLQAEFDARVQLLDQLPPSSNDGLKSAAMTAPKAIAAEMSSLTETIAASDLQKRLLEVAANTGVVVHSIQAQVNADSDPQLPKRIYSELTFDGKIEALQRFLFELETNVPFIFVDAVAVQLAPSEAKKDVGDAILRATLTTSAYWNNPQVDEKTR
jgi:general secretion pathway protein M